AGEVDVEHLHEGGDLVFLVARQDAGAIDQRVDAFVRLRESVYGLIAGDVELLHGEPRARTKLRARDRGIIDGCCRHGRTEITEQIGNRSADVAGASDDGCMKT